MTYQIRQTCLVVDDDMFVWPTDLNAKTWAEFRPNDSTIDRPFTQISPVEIANAMRLLRDRKLGMSDADLDAGTLHTFGRKRKTQQFAAHLKRARSSVRERLDVMYARFAREAVTLRVLPECGGAFTRVTCAINYPRRVFRDV